MITADEGAAPSRNGPSESTSPPERSFDQELEWGEPEEFASADRGHDEDTRQGQSWITQTSPTPRRPGPSPTRSMSIRQRSRRRRALEPAHEDPSRPAVWSFDSASEAGWKPSSRQSKSRLTRAWSPLHLRTAQTTGAKLRMLRRGNPSGCRQPGIADASMLALTAAGAVAEASSATDLLEPEADEPSPKKEKKSRFGRDSKAPASRMVRYARTRSSVSGQAPPR